MLYNFNTMRYFFCFIFASFLLFSYETAYSITLKELLQEAKTNYPALKEQAYKKDAEYLRYKASFDPYYPSLDLSLNYNRYLQSEISPLQDDKGYFGFSVNLGYKLFDPKRAYIKDSYSYTFLIEKQTLSLAEKELFRQVKDLYYRILAEKMILGSRNEAFKAAEKTFLLAQAKRDVGLAKLSDVYQAKVRMENARLDLVTSKSNLAKLIYEISSICNKNLVETDFEEILLAFDLPLKEKELFNIALENRDELIRERLLEKRLEAEKQNVYGDFLPQAVASLSYNRYDRSFFPSPDETRFGLSLSWNLFSGFGKYYRYDASERDILSQKQRVEEAKRVILLDVKKVTEDFNSNVERVKVAEEILKSATETYQQSYEEYRVGKGDILTLLQAEINLSAARESRISALLLVYQSKTALERALGITSFEDIK